MLISMIQISLYENSDVTTEYSAFRGGRHIVLLRLASASALALASGLTLGHPLLDFFWVHQNMIPAI